MAPLKVLFLPNFFNSYYIHQGNKSDQERQIANKKVNFYAYKKILYIFKRWVQFRVGAIPHLPSVQYLFKF